MTIRLTELNSNVKGDLSIKFTSQYVLLVGKARSGKSRISQSIELAISGAVSDVNGRQTIKKAVELMALAPGRVGPLVAKARFSDGSESSYVLHGSTEKTNGESLIPPRWLPEADADLAFPLRSVREAVLGSSDKMRNFFVNFTAPMKAEDVYALLPAGMQGDYKLATATMTTRDSTAKKILSALTYAKKKAGEEKTKGETKNEMAVEIGRNLAPPPDDLQLVEAKAEAEAAFKLFNVALSNQQTRDALVAQYEELTAKIEAGRAALVGKEAEAAAAEIAANMAMLDLRTMAEAAEAIDSSNTALNSAFITILEWCAEHETLTIPHIDYTFESAELFAAFYESLQNASAEAAGYLAALDLAKKAADDAASLLVWAKDSVELLKEDILKNEQELSGMEEQFEQLSEADVETAKSQFEAAQQKLADMKSLKDQWSVAEKAAESTADTNAEAKRWKDLAEQLETIVATQLDSGVLKFEQKVQKLLSPSDKFALRLRDGDRDVCQYGLNVDGVLHTALSGVEGTLMLMAMSEACRDTKLPWSCMIFDDRGIDPDTLGDCLQLWEKSSSMVIVPTPTLPSNVSSRWQIIEVK